MFRPKPRVPQPYLAWIEELAAEGREMASWMLSRFEPKGSAAGRRLLAASPEEQRGFVLAAVE